MRDREGQELKGNSNVSTSLRKVAQETFKNDYCKNKHFSLKPSDVPLELTLVPGSLTPG